MFCRFPRTFRAARRSARAPASSAVIALFCGRHATQARHEPAAKLCRSRSDFVGSSSMSLEAIVFDWGGTLTAGSTVVSLELVDVWQVTAKHLDPAREQELTAALVEAEQRFWERTTTTLESGTLSDLLRAASHAVGLDVADALLEEAATQHLDAWTPHIAHDPDAVGVLTEVRERGIRTALLSNTHWPRSFHEHFLERDGLVDLIEA